MDETMYRRLTTPYTDEQNDIATDELSEVITSVINDIGDNLSVADAAITMFESVMEVIGFDAAAIHEDVLRVFAERINESEDDTDVGV